MTVETMVRVRPVRAREFGKALGTAQSASDKIAGSTSPVCDLPAGREHRWFLSEDNLSGFGILEDGTLVGLFSLVKGRGTLLLTIAAREGARGLDCFDGYLPDLYRRHGWTETHREPNWTEGGPDVVFMSLVG